MPSFYVYSLQWPDAVYHGYSSDVFRRMKEHRSRCRDGDELVANPLVDFGYYYKDGDGNPASELAWSDVFNVLRDLPEVRKLDAGDGLYLNGLREDVAIGVFKFPQLGTITVIDGDTGNSL